MNNKFKVALGAFLSIFFVASSSKVFVIFMPELERIGYSISSISLLTILMVASIFVSGLMINRVINMIGMKLTMILGAVSTSVAYVLFALNYSILFIAIGFILMGLGVTFSGYTPASILINKWFENNKGLVLSIVFTGMNLGASMYSYISGILMEHYSFNTTCLCISLIAAVFPILSIFIFIKDKPSRKGQSKFRDNNEQNDRQEESMAVGSKSALKTSAFWRIMIISFIAVGVVSTIQGFIPAHLEFEGMDSVSCSRIYSIMMLISAPALILGGYIADKFSVKTFILYTSLMLITGTVMILVVPTIYNVMVIAAIVMGLAYPLCSITPSLLLNEAFSKQTFDRLIGILQAVTFVSIGAMFPIVGLMYQCFNSYRQSMLLIMVLTFIMVLFVLFEKRKAKY